MKVPDFPLTADMLDAMLLVTRVTSETMRNALHDHLVLGESQNAAAERYGYSRQQIHVRAKHILEMKSAFDLYAALAARGAGCKPRRSNSDSTLRIENPKHVGSK